MKISLVTLSYNQASFLEEAIRSVVDQDCEDCEYIVVDPGSSDGSRHIIDAFRDRIDHVIFDADDGPADGLNHGFACASGQVFGFLNADDALMPGSLSAVTKAFRQHPEADVVSAHGWLVDKTGKPMRPKYSHHFGAWRYLHRGAYLLQQSTFFRAEAFRKVGGFNPANKTCWDGELWLDMALAGCRFQLLHDYWSYFRVYKESISGQIGLNLDSWRSYEWDRKRMFRQATGRDPAGLSYRLRWVAAQVLKWAGNPMAMRARLPSALQPAPAPPTFSVWRGI